MWHNVFSLNVHIPSNPTGEETWSTPSTNTEYRLFTRLFTSVVFQECAGVCRGVLFLCGDLCYQHRWSVTWRCVTWRYSCVVLNEFSKKKKNPCQNTTTPAMILMKAKLRPAQFIRPSVGQKRTPQSKQPHKCACERSRYLTKNKKCFW